MGPRVGLDMARREKSLSLQGFEPARSLVYWVDYPRVFCVMVVTEICGHV